MYIRGYKIGNWSSFVKATQVTDSGEWWRAGYVGTKLGIVGYYAEPYYFTLDFVHNGRLYTKKHDIPAATERQVKLYANRFAKQIVNQ